jgi:methylamine dehydrogenase accessory protein MauD
MSDLWLASYVLLWLIVGALCFIVVGLLRQLGIIQLRLGPEPGVLVTKEGLDRGSLAPDFAATDVKSGREVSLASLRGRRVLLLFFTPTCIACRQLVPAVNDAAREHRGDTDVVTVCHGSATTCQEFAAAFRLDPPLLLDSTNAIAEDYDVRMTPFGFLIDHEGVVRLRGVASTWPQLQALLDETGTVLPTPWHAIPTGPASGTQDAVTSN